ncbi:hypothetical protein [Sphingomonas sp. Leaf357]|nr:hypothetical protein [Sphingomonas sp. Leaf357]
MRSFLKSAFLWQFAAGFLLGAVGMVTLQPQGAIQNPFASVAHADR